MDTNGDWAAGGPRPGGKARFFELFLELFPGSCLFLVAAALLTSIGGVGIYASPVTLPLLVFAVWRHPTLPFRIMGAVIGGLTAALGMWGLIYWVAGEPPVLIWLLPLVSGVATAFGFFQLGRKSRHSNSVQPAT